MLDTLWSVITQWQFPYNVLRDCRPLWLEFLRSSTQHTGLFKTCQLAETVLKAHQLSTALNITVLRTMTTLRTLKQDRNKKHTSRKFRALNCCNQTQYAASWVMNLSNIYQEMRHATEKKTLLNMVPISIWKRSFMFVEKLTAENHEYVEGGGTDLNMTTRE